MSFLSGFAGGYAEQAEKMKKDKTPGVLRRKKKKATPDPGVPDYKHGGRVKRTGLIHAHKGETVLPARARKRGKRR